ncbi:MAG: hypothetical protein HUU22_11165 [Phycisphaerae bacterium]|nr:hypothetical protein [Phycisphaerae bacterium]NUQ46581.1 hypothetical protein [Phycisphaerae bacterium]
MISDGAASQNAELPPSTAMRERLNERMRRVLELPLDPHGGSEYWLERQRAAGFDFRREIRDVSDLSRLGTMTPDALAARPLSYFVPRSLHATRRDWILAQTGGTTGRPAWSAYLRDEFEEAFVVPFLTAAAHVGFPRGEPWLYVGPSGPHIIGRAAVALARGMDSGDPFMVDFDPRWAKKLPPDSFAAQRYLEHVVAQSLDVLTREPVGVLFTTPPLLAALAARMNDAARGQIRGVHYGGMRVAPALLRQAQVEWFPGAVHLSGYGNTLFGCCLELITSPGRTPTYFPWGERLWFTVQPGSQDGEIAPNMLPPRGRVAFTRLDETMLIINMLERDEASLVNCPAEAPAGFGLPGLHDPGPLADAALVAAGLY